MYAKKIQMFYKNKGRTFFFSLKASFIILLHFYLFFSWNGGSNLNYLKQDSTVELFHISFSCSRVPVGSKQQQQQDFIV